MVLGLSNDIKVKIDSEKECVQKVSVELPASKVKETIEKAFASVQAKAKVPGFRPGKTPIELIKKTFQDAAYAQAQDDLLREGVLEAMKVKKINAIQTPVVHTAHFTPDKPFHFEFTVEVAPTFKVAPYKGLKLTRKSDVLKDEDVEKTLKQLLESNASLTESKAETLSSTHFAVIDYEGFLDGKPMEGAKAENFLIDMSAPQAIAGLAEGLQGAKPGETKEVTVKFPADSPSVDLAGKEAVFKVKLNAIKEKQLRALDDEFAKDMGLKSLEELKGKVRETLEKDKKQASRRDLENQVIEKLVEDNKFFVPASLVERQVEHLKSQQKKRMAGQGTAEADLDKMLEGHAAELKVRAEKEVRLVYVLSTIGEAEKIDVTEDELSNKINEIVKGSGAPSAGSPSAKEMEKTIRETYLDSIHSQLKDEKLFDWLISQAKIKESTGGAA